MYAHARRILMLLAAGWAVSAVAEDPPESCESVIWCEAPDAPILTMGDDCQDENCVPIDTALRPRLWCAYDNGHVDCEAWPRSNVPKMPITYRWSTDLGVADENRPFTDDPHARFSCLPMRNPSVTVTLTVQSPVGLQSSTSMRVACAPQ